MFKDKINLKQARVLLQLLMLHLNLFLLLEKKENNGRRILLLFNPNIDIYLQINSLTSFRQDTL